MATYSMNAVRVTPEQKGGPHDNISLVKLTSEGIEARSM